MSKFTDRVLAMSDAELLAADIAVAYSGLCKIFRDSNPIGPWRVYLQLLEQCVNIQAEIAKKEKEKEKRNETN